MKEKNLQKVLWIFLLSMCFISCSDSDGGKPSENELYANFVGSWNFSGEVKFDDTTTEIQGVIEYYKDKMFKATNILYRDGELYLKEELSGTCFIIRYEDSYELNIVNDDSDKSNLIFEDLRIGYNGIYQCPKEHSILKTSFSKDLTTITFYRLYEYAGSRQEVIVTLKRNN